MRELLEDSAYNLSLDLIDTAFTAHQFAFSINLVNNVITEAQTAPRFSLANPSLKTAACDSRGADNKRWKH